MFPNKAFLNAFLKIALPVALQNMFISMLGIVDTLVIGQMGEIPIAAIGLATQLYFILTLVLFGITSGAAIFTAQYWGQKDLTNVRRVQGVSITLGAGFSVLIALVATVFPQQVLSFYTTDPAVIEFGPAVPVDHWPQLHPGGHNSELCLGAAYNRADQAAGSGWDRIPVLQYFFKLLPDSGKIRPAPHGHAGRGGGGLPGTLPGMLHLAVDHLPAQAAPGRRAG